MTEIIANREVVQRLLPHGGGAQTPDRIVVHAMAYQLDTKDGRLYAASFLDRVVKLSAHILVAPDATPIRCRRDDQVAWHAKGFNTNSLGIEVLVPGVYNYDTFLRAIDEPWVRQRQFNMVAGVIRHWRDKWGIDFEPGEIDRHSDVDPDRKHDPGEGFPWDKLREAAA